MGVFGCAGLDYLKNEHEPNIVVESKTMEDDIIPVDHLFRNWNEMPICEQIALQNTVGKVLDVGGGVGSHSLYLQKKGIETDYLEIEPELCEVAQKRGVQNIIQKDFFKYTPNKKYSTILFLMNGIGIGGTFNAFNAMLQKCKSLLEPGGKIIFDSTDIAFCYEDEDGSYVLPLNIEYHGFVEFRLKYKNLTDNWFKWAYYDIDKIKSLLSEEWDFKILKEEGPAYTGAITLL